MLSTRITSNMHCFSSSFRWWAEESRLANYENSEQFEMPTGSETRSSTKRPVAPEVSVHHTRPDEFQEQIQRVLEFVVHPSLFDRVVHGTSKGPVHVSIQQEPVLRKSHQT